MFGTIAILKPKSGQDVAVLEALNAWWEERRPKVPGAIASTLHRNDKNPQELIMSVVFDSKETYEANASDPEQDKWYQHLRGLLESDPVWMDGDVLACRHV
jgi:quinol monooxygenase YgiN